ncbi:MAG: fatty acid desaturase [Hyphomicrobiales bacterium]
MKRQIEQAPEGVLWEDLKIAPWYQFLIELFLPIPWLVLSVALYGGPFWFLGPVGSFFFFLCCLRLNHEAIHGNLGLRRHLDHTIMYGLSALMFGSNHADAFCHLLHHKDTLGKQDHEGHCAHLPAWKVFLYGPRFPIDLNLAAWRYGGPRWRSRISTDWILVLVVVSCSIVLDFKGLQMHFIVMLIGQCLTAFFAVWITHQGTIGTGLAGRSQRGPLAWLAYQMFYHREHHLFPTVPVSRLGELAQRLDDNVPGYASARQPVSRVLGKG